LKRKQKVLAYLIRSGPTGPELLVFDHVDFPEAGTQVPAGTLEPGEDPAEGVLRELFEEAGVSAQIVRHLGTFPFWSEHHGEWHERHVYHLTTTADLPDQWDHAVSDGVADKGMRFRCFWLPVNQAAERLSGGQGLYVKHLEP
jgi:8-oxo-dGTP pyrophosphatase MutT (NUDIX family)